MKKINFSLTIRKSFLKYNNHPITIPSRCSDDISNLGMSRSGEVRMTFPDGSIAPAYIYQGIAGYGPYYQIKIRGEYSGSGISELKPEQQVTIEIMKCDDKIAVNVLK